MLHNCSLPRELRYLEQYADRTTSWRNREPWFDTGHGKKGKAVPLQAWTSPGGSRRLRLPDFKTIGT